MTEDQLLPYFVTTRQRSVDYCEPLLPDDFGLQAEAFTSPPKWHLAHTSWFFETFLLKPFVPGYQAVNPAYEVLFNSYYNGIGEQFPRPRRGLLSRPTIDEVLAYRRHIDQHMTQLLADTQHVDRLDILNRCRLGIEHEQQHQELFFTDLKYSLSINPLLPTYSQLALASTDTSPNKSSQWLDYDGGLVEIGCDESGKLFEDFSFDNEGPRHQVFLQPFALATQLVSNGDFQRFIEEDGYLRPDLWLADGWAAVQEQQWQAPLYWRKEQQQYYHFTLHGEVPIDPTQAVCHISAYEADAFARWAGCRLPTEAEWEIAAAGAPAPTRDTKPCWHPQAAGAASGLQQLYRDCWQWTSSSYRPYPGYTTAEGAIGEYNGKFMSNQWVLRGGSCATNPDHLRLSYRNFFYPQDRWQFTGLRLAKNR